MVSSVGRRTARRFATGLGVVAAGSLILPSGTAHADPEQSKEDVEEKLDDLNQKAGKIVDDYNEAKEDHKAAKKKAGALKKEVGDEEERYDKLRDDVAEFATAAYKSNDLGATSTVLSVDKPEDLLDQSADIGYLSESQKTKLDEFGESHERLFKLKDEADDALGDAKDKKKSASKKKESVEKKISKQEKLLEKFPDADPASKGDDSGASYSGSASGDAKKALEFAYSKVGLPYKYGAAGPDSYDCSGLTMRAWGSAGVSLPRNTSAQAQAGERVSRDSLKPGDLVFFFDDLGHMGMYAGGGKMVHAPRTGKNVEVVSLSGYWDGQFQFGVRP